MSTEADMSTARTHASFAKKNVPFYSSWPEISFAGSKPKKYFFIFSNFFTLEWIFVAILWGRIGIVCARLIDCFFKSIHVKSKFLVKDFIPHWRIHSFRKVTHSELHHLVKVFIPHWEIHSFRKVVRSEFTHLVKVFIPYWRIHSFRKVITHWTQSVSEVHHSPFKISNSSFV